MAKVREGDGVTLVMYAVLKDGGECDRTYSLENKAVTMEIYPPSGPFIMATPTVAASDNTDRSAWMATYDLPADKTAGKMGAWIALLRVDDDNITLGRLEFEVVKRTDDTGPCEGDC